MKINCWNKGKKLFRGVSYFKKGTRNSKLVHLVLGSQLEDTFKNTQLKGRTNATSALQCGYKCIHVSTLRTHLRVEKGQTAATLPTKLWLHKVFKKISEFSWRQATATISSSPSSVTRVCLLQCAEPSMKEIQREPESETVSVIITVHFALWS